ncbi:heat-inducible transcriptional repressor HrcA [Mycoplasma sp. SG1]|uniref:heat-inducible transcriptional repressor HrcA n=1 Tax=Mycoplasma sp. SG1 TaxID=2810348 RepID=UPI0020250D7F|nr:heat-inducible transcriptional repressor HrcA [Mycoplasma sp. SG1]URM53159.1 heat-inducible transcriptional repressor HrcA [Mycoplasma sp. SG1]
MNNQSKDNLNQDQKFLLKLIIDFFIDFNEPVSSNVLKDFYRLSISSATIRNRMSELEELNYITKNNQTSGRVPTDLGYHYYVQYLREPKEAEIKELTEHLKKVINNRSLTIEEVVENSCKIISDSINITSLYTTSDASENEVLNHLDLFLLKDFNSLSVIVTDSGKTYTKNFLIDKSININDLKLCISVINEKLKGTKLIEINKYLLGLKPILIKKIINFEKLFESCICKIFNINLFNDYVYGIENLIAPNQFNEVENLKNLIKVLENHSIWEILQNKLAKPSSFKEKDKDINILIGKEINQDAFRNLSLISTTYNTKNNNSSQINKSGKIVLIGPKRINYSNIFYILEWLKDNLKNRGN